MRTVERRFLRGPNVWSGNNCLDNVVDMGALAGALSTDVPGLGERLLSLLPGLHDFAEPLRRGSFIAEVIGRIALELQCIAGAAPRSRCALTVHGRRGLVRIVVDGQAEQLVVHAFELATAIVAALCAGKKIAIRTRLAALRRLASAGHARAEPPVPRARLTPIGPAAYAPVPARLDIAERTCWT
jgi:cyanophycin synthetase